MRLSQSGPKSSSTWPKISKANNTTIFVVNRPDLDRAEDQR
jgi:hypothetical protein